MAETKQRGVDRSEELESSQIRPDTRPLLTKARSYFSTTDGVVAAMLWLQGIALLTVFVPMSGELVVVASWLFYQLYVNPGHNDPKRKIPGTSRIAGKFRIYDFPYRVPFSAKRFDGSYAIPRLGNGITYLGKEISSKLEIWSSDSDLRTHMLVLGTTGSGKTELLLGLVFNALVQNSGFIYTDGKGDVALWNNVFRLARYLGRECDLLLINFLTSGRDFLDKQVDRTTNTMNPFALGSSGMLIELIISLMDDSGGGGDMWKGRAIAFVAGLTRVLCFLRDRGYILLDSNKFIEYFELPVIEQIVWDKKITIDGKEITIKDPLFDKVLEPLKAFVLTLPGYTQEKKGKQEQKTLEQHGFITMQLTRLFGDLSFTYGYIFQTLLGEVDMYDVVINRRILAVLLPALERAPDSLKMLGKLIVGAIKQMMAGCLGNRVEGSVREIVKARPTNAAVPFYVVLDEYGYYAVLGFAVAPAQARSLGFPQPLHSLVRMADGTVRKMSEMQVGDEILAPNGATVRVEQVLEYDELPIARLTLESGRAVDAARVHHWPVRVMYQQLRVMTTQEIEVLVKSGVTVELATAGGDELGWDVVTSVATIGNQPARCLVVADEMHCYITDHDIVTHNCITFAAQDFSSLQKASKEEADATWENTNVRCVGKITSGEKSETWERIRGVAGETLVYENGAKEHNADSMFKWSTNMDARVNRVKRLEYDDLAQQENGEFTFLIGKKNSQSAGGVRVIRARTFFTQVDEAPDEIRINHFLKVEPPKSGFGEQDLERLDQLEKLLGKMIADGSLAKAFPNEPEAMLSMKQPFYKMSTFMREAREKHSLSLPEAWRVAFVCDDQETKVVAGAAALAAAPATADGELLLSGAVAAAAPVIASSAEVDETDVAVMEGPEEPTFDFDPTEDTPLESDGTGVSASLLGLEPISLDSDDDLPSSDADKRGAGAVSGGTAGGDTGSGEGDGGREGGSSGGGSSGGMGMALKPSPVEMDDEVPEEAASLDPKTQVTDFLDGYDFGRSDEQGADSRGGAAERAGTEEPQTRVSALTFRVLGQAEEPNEIQSYLADAIETTRIALGTSRDSLENKTAAQRGVLELERVTSYVEGITPGPATLEDWDATLEDLESAADANPPNWL
ncbi:type IV secretory system conjugative DNA transfer family protein [Burkholderia arboris]|uniref:type IV secretory system conjugative DNA transfer family protein n=1 Tax=Burkholderia arboris TaxID=488730 RepID=UPI001CF439EB|nr:type IV secretory system conjugative DNA transfer family protein [Burkholderia arboris]MCA8050651.1 type IV secretory system conjugative DNA transfer family protein [Burkholderia arboris]